MPRIAEESIQRVADVSDIVDVIGSYFPLKRAGTNFRALCPFHKEKSPSFNVNPSKQSFHCFGCGAGGGVIRFVMDYEHVDFPSAVRRLAQRAGIVIEEENDPQEQQRRDLRSRLLELHKETARWYQSQLLRSSEADHARAYLKRRGMTKEIVLEWQLGYAPDGWEIFRSWGIAQRFTREEMLAGGLLTAKEGDQSGGYDRFRDRLMFPICNDYGEVIAFSGRILNDSDREAKYLNSPETPIFSKGRVLFGLDKSKRSLIEAGTAIVMEGQIDLISSFEHGVKNVVAPQGTAFTNDQARLLRRFVERVILCFDSDTAGQNAVEKSLPPLLSAGIEVRVASLPKGNDPDSLIRKQGVEAFQGRLKDARDFFDHTIERVMQETGENFGPREKAAIARKLGGYLALLPDAALRETSTAYVASRLGLSISALIEAGKKNPITLQESEDSTTNLSSPNSTHLSASTQLICRLAIESQEARHYLSNLPDSTLVELDPELALLEKIIPHLQSSLDLSLTAALSLLPLEIQSLVSGWDMRKTEDPLTAVQQAIRELRLRDLKKRETAIKLELHKPGLSLELILAINQEILDLRAKIDELSTPVTLAS